jgi:hypothetical protein
MPAAAGATVVVAVAAAGLGVATGAVEALTAALLAADGATGAETWGEVVGTAGAVLMRGAAAARVLAQLARL